MPSALQSTSSTAVSRGDSNRLEANDRAAHDWYRFVLSFPPHLVRDYLQQFGLERRQRVLDPFCGTGTSLVECKKSGFPSIGIEANPVACFASRVKLHWDIDPDALLDHGNKVGELALRKLRAQGINDCGDDLPLFAVNGSATPSLESLPEESWDLL